VPGKWLIFHWAALPMAGPSGPVSRGFFSLNHHLSVSTSRSCALLAVKPTIRPGTSVLAIAPVHARTQRREHTE
jgi:hypothetical protein